MKIKPWEIIDGELYQYKGYRSSGFRASRYARNLRWMENLKVIRKYNEKIDVWEIFVAPHYNEV